MASLFTPFQQFFDGDGDPLVSGTLDFFNQGTTSRQDTFSDASLTIKNANPVVLDGEGRLPNIIFGSGVYKVILKSKSGVLIDELDPVGGDAGSVVAFSDWISTTIYNKEAIVTGSDGHFYQTIIDSNLGNDPTLNPGTNVSWKEVRFIGMFNTAVTYDAGEIVQTSDGLLWASVVASNLNNDPSTDDGTNWIPAVDGTKVSTSTSTSVFNAFSDERTRNDAGMGSAEWGLSNSTNELVNEGIYCDPTISNGGLYFGYDDFATETGISRTKHPIIHAAGIEIILRDVAIASSDILNSISLPASPDGLTTYDSVTGDVVTHGSIAAAFASETADNKVIISRKDTVFLEVWAEKINDLDVVYPLGNVQNAETDYEGITLATNSIDQGYSAFGEWDTVTTGNNAVWSTLSQAEKNLFTEDPANNIFGDIQIRYRVRVVEGVSDTITTPIDAQNSAWFNGSEFFRPRGKIVTPVDLSHVTSEGFIGTVDNIIFTPIDGWNLGEAYCSKVAITNPWPGSDDFAVDGLISEIPICYVERRNQGAYEPTFNPNGADKFTGDLFWYETVISNRDSTEDCFALANGDGDIASANSGRSDGKFFDSTHSSDLEDLRMSTKRLAHDEIREKYKHMADDGDVLGYEGIPFTKVIASTGVGAGTTWTGTGIGDAAEIGSKIYSVTAGNVITTAKVLTRVDADSVTVDTSAADRSGNLVGYITQLHDQANPTWSDILGDPTDTLATWPNGVEGQWIPNIPDGTAKDFDFNRKVTSATFDLERTSDNGVNWMAQSGISFDSTNNLKNSAIVNGGVELWHYETQAHFTEDSVNSEVLIRGDVFAVNDNNISNGNLLLSSLIGKVGIGDAEPRNLDFSLIKKGSIRDGVLSPIAGNEPTHPSLELGDSTSPAIKTLDYLSESNGTAKLNYAYKEMVFDSTMQTADQLVQITEATTTKTAGVQYFVTDGDFKGAWLWKNTTGTALTNAGFYMLNGEIRFEDSTIVFAIAWNGTGWGDNNEFDIVDDQSTTTDDNGNTVLIGTASFNTQFFIVEN